MPSSAAVLLLLAPALLAAPAALALAVRPGAPLARAAGGAAVLAAMAVALAGAAGPFEVPGLLLGARAGIDLEGRAVMFLGGAALLAALLDRAPAAAGALPWRALLAAGLALTAVAFDAGTLATGFIALAAGAYGLVVRRGPGAVRPGAAFAVLAVLGEVLLVDALAEYGHAAESARLDEMAAAAGEALGPAAPLLLAAAYGLPAALAGAGGPPLAAAAFVAAGVLGVIRLRPSPGPLAGDAVALAALAGFAVLGVLVSRLLLRWRRFAPGAPAGAGHGPGHDHGHGEDPAAGTAAPAPPGAAARALGVAEGALLRWGERAVLFAAVVLALLAALHAARGG
jgi:hypothetical protein